MDEIIARCVITTASGSFISTKGAKVVERNVNEFEVNELNETEAFL
ncbi:DUF2922 family protein [Peribacillus huizhouensis]